MNHRPGSDDDDVRDPIARALRTLHGVLPDQAPIGVFIHHNTLHALQHLPFHDAVQQGGALLGARAYPRLSLLRDAWRSGRIADQDVDAVLATAAAATTTATAATTATTATTAATTTMLPWGLDVRAVQRALLRDDLDVDDGAGVAFAAAADPLFQRALALAAQLTTGTMALPTAATTNGATARRHRDALLALDAGDVDDVVHPELSRLALAFLDLGQARARMPGREHGFLRAAAAVLAASPPRGAPGVGKDADRVLAEQRSARDVVDEVLGALGVTGGDDVHDWLVATALSLRGVAGMFSRFERHPDEGDAPATLIDHLAVRLLIERRVVERLARRASLPTDWTALRAAQQATTTSSTTTNATNATACAAWLLAGLARAAGTDLQGASVDDARRLLVARDAFPELERNKLLFLAYERGYRRRVLSGMVALQKRVTATATTTTATATTRPTAQVIFCIDEREESIHRALEEIDPSIETFGAAGFFGMAIDYQGLDDHEPAAYCPVVVTPAHEVHESPVFTARQWNRVRGRLRGAWHAVERSVAGASRSLLGGAGASLLFGPIAGAIVAGRVIAPHQSLGAWHAVRRSLAPTPATRLSGVRPLAEVTATASGKPMGFSLDEAADRVANLLKNIGMVDNTARVVVVLGHGSTSLNNPHESAHDCGACGGRRGGANARLFAALANRVDVRAAVKARGVAIPDDTWFLGGLHDTADDGVTLSDLEDVPASHSKDVEDIVVTLEAARKESARERCRRFLDAPLGIGRDGALAHVETRARHLAQPRPEYGHCTNASAVVGRRTLTRGLHLDRRAFLISYDPTLDKDDVIVERILAAVGPVGAGISLEYYFSSIDNEVYGCGTKLPHNVTGLLGVMNGHQGDLRTGLPLQMVELHEPMRLLLIVEASPEALLGVAGKQAEVRELVVKEWVQLVSVHPTTGAFMVFEGGQFVPFVADDDALPEVERSIDWHGRSREYVGPAITRAALPRAAGLASTTTRTTAPLAAAGGAR